MIPITNPVIAQACRFPHDQSHDFAVVVSNVDVMVEFSSWYTVTDSSDVSLFIKPASTTRSWMKIILLILIFVFFLGLYFFLTPFPLSFVTRFGLYIVCNSHMHAVGFSN